MEIQIKKKLLINKYKEDVKSVGISFPAKPDVKSWNFCDIRCYYAIGCPGDCQNDCKPGCTRGCSEGCYSGTR